MSIGPDRPFLMTHAPYVTPKARRSGDLKQRIKDRLLVVGRQPTIRLLLNKFESESERPGELSLVSANTYFRLSPLHKVNFTFGTLRQHSRSSRENRSSEVS